LCYSIFVLGRLNCDLDSEADFTWTIPWDGEDLPLWDTYGPTVGERERIASRSGRSLTHIMGHRRAVLHAVITPHNINSARRYLRVSSRGGSRSLGGLA
jgi:hypothetical protein